jgi:hypothetical protein
VTVRSPVHNGQQCMLQVYSILCITDVVDKYSYIRYALTRITMFHVEPDVD